MYKKVTDDRLARIEALDTAASAFKSGGISEALVLGIVAGVTILYNNEAERELKALSDLTIKFTIADVDLNAMIDALAKE